MTLACTYTHRALSQVDLFSCSSWSYEERSGFGGMEDCYYGCLCDDDISYRNLRGMFPAPCLICATKRRSNLVLARCS